jgi:hypothetical protein
VDFPSFHNFCNHFPRFLNQQCLRRGLLGYDSMSWCDRIPPTLQMKAACPSCNDISQCTVSYPRRPRHESSSPWKSQASHAVFNLNVSEGCQSSRTNNVAVMVMNAHKHRCFKQDRISEPNDRSEGHGSLKLRCPWDRILESVKINLSLCLTKHYAVKTYPVFN